MAVPFVHVRASGSYREIGRQIGEAARRQIDASLAFYREQFAAMSGGLSFVAAEQRAAAYLRHARAWLPQYVEEIEGMAEGSGQRFAELFVPNCAEEFTSGQPVAGAPAPLPAGAGQGDHCTAVAVSAGGRHVVGHNMDWYVVDVENNVLFDVTVPDGTRILTIAGVPYLPMLGMNSHGVGNVSNSLHSSDDRVGVPNAFVRRWSIEAPTVDEARARGTIAARARGTNQLFADTQGRIEDVETSATAFAVAVGDTYLAHTNHYDLAEMAGYEAVYHEETRTRLETARRLLAEGVARGDDPIELVARVLRCHEPAPDAAVCGHPDTSQPLAEQGQTVGSMICDLDERRLYACAGPPCENPYRVFEMA